MGKLLFYRALPLALLTASIWVLYREFHETSWGEVVGAARNWSPVQVALAIICCLVNYLLAGALEWRGVRWMGGRAPLREVLLVSFVANALGHSLGANVVVSAVARARLYAKYDVSPVQAAGVTLYLATAFVLGLGVLAGLGMLLGDIAPSLRAQTSTVGAVLLLAVAAYLTACAVLRRPVTILSRTVVLPRPGEALLQTSLGAVEVASAVAILWGLLPKAVSFANFLASYVAAYLVGLVSGVPGGAGVFESALAKLLPAADRPALAAGLLGYRLLFYVLPLAVSVLALALMLGVPGGLMRWRRRA